MKVIDLIFIYGARCGSAFVLCYACYNMFTNTNWIPVAIIMALVSPIVWAKTEKSPYSRDAFRD